MADIRVEAKDSYFEGNSSTTIVHHDVPQDAIMECSHLLQRLISLTAENCEYEDVTGTGTVITNENNEQPINRTILSDDNAPSNADMEPTTSSNSFVLEDTLSEEETILRADNADIVPVTTTTTTSSNTSVLEDTVGVEGTRKRGRKRMRQPEQWKRNVRKRKRQGGNEYINSKGKSVSCKKLVNIDCTKCPMKCSNKFTEDCRKNIFDGFWSLDDAGKLAFYGKFTNKVEKTRKRTLAESSRRNFTYLYSLSSQNVQHKVCQKFFLATLGISHSRIKWFYSNHVAPDNAVPTPVQHGKFLKFKLPEPLVERVRQHISSFPAVESHYCRERTQKKYLEAKLNIALMYDLYREQCTEGNEEYVKQHKYRQIFNEEFNLSFIKPKSDRCDSCEEFKMGQAKGKVFTEDEINKIERHKFLKVDAQEERERDRKSNSAVLSFDLENVLSLPRANVSNFYYRRKLSVYNLTVHCSLDKHVYCCIWHEARMGRGGNAIASALLKALNQFIERHPTVTDIILWSDSCVPQNRNSLMAYALMAFMKKHPHLNSITQKYSESGHSLIQEVDNAHSAIEKQLRCCETYSPVSLVRQLLSVRRNPKLTVIQMKVDDFFNFDDSKLMNFSKVPFSTVKQLKYEKEKLNFVTFKTCHTADHDFSCVKITKEQRKSRGGISKLVAPHEIPSLCNIKILKSVNPLPREKILDLEAMYAFIPAIDVQLFESIIKENQSQTPTPRKK